MCGVNGTSNLVGPPSAELFLFPPGCTLILVVLSLPPEFQLGRVLENSDTNVRISNPATFSNRVCVLSLAIIDDRTRQYSLGFGLICTIYFS